jgi:hypothetical protein
LITGNGVSLPALPTRRGELRRISPSCRSFEPHFVCRKSLL